MFDFERNGLAVLTIEGARSNEGKIERGQDRRHESRPVLFESGRKTMTNFGIFNHQKQPWKAVKLGVRPDFHTQMYYLDENFNQKARQG